MPPLPLQPASSQSIATAHISAAVTPYLLDVPSFMLKDLNIAVTTNIAVPRCSKQVRHAIAHLANAIATHAQIRLLQTCSPSIARTLLRKDKVMPCRIFDAELF
jgi:siroheme synthase (precorrin-2 oxidase/ferrochelatase)